MAAQIGLDIGGLVAGGPGQQSIQGKPRQGSGQPHRPRGVILAGPGEDLRSVLVGLVHQDQSTDREFSGGRHRADKRAAEARADQDKGALQEAQQLGEVVDHALHAARAVVVVAVASARAVVDDGGGMGGDGGLHQAPGGAGHTGTRFENDGGRTRPTNPIVQSAAVVQGRVPCRTVGVAGLIVIAQYEALYIRVIRLVCPSCWAAQAWWARCRTYRRRTWPTRSPDPRPPWLRYH